MSKKIFIVCLLILGLSCYGHSNESPFSPIVKNWSVDNYHRSHQNWAVAQDADGIVYIGNNSGLMRFNGSSWRFDRLPRNGILRSILLKDDRIYVGSYEEFGYFEKDKNQDLVYHDLHHLLDNQSNDLEIWSIVEHGGKIYFQSFNDLFVYDGQSLTSIIDVKPLNLFEIRDQLYFQQISGDFCVFKDGHPTSVVPRIHGDDVVGAMEHPEGLLLLTKKSGLYLFADGKLTPLGGDDLNEYVFNRAVKTLSDTPTYLLGSINNGICAVDADGSVLWTLNRKTDLQNNTILGMFPSQDGNVWAALDNGISYVMVNSPVYMFPSTQVDLGMIYDFCPSASASWIATNHGVFRLDEDGVRADLGVLDQSWYFFNSKFGTFCGNNSGTFLFKNGQRTDIFDSYGGMCMRNITIDEDEYFVEGSYGMLNVYTPDESGKIVYRNSLEGATLVNKLEIDSRGNIWCSHMRGGIIRIVPNETFTEVEKVQTIQTLGDVRDSIFNVLKINERVVFTNGKSFFAFDDIQDSIVPFKLMDDAFGELNQIHQSVGVGGSKYWLVGTTSISLVRSIGNDFRLLKTIPYSSFGLSTDEWSSMVFDKSTGYSYLCLNGRILRIDDLEITKQRNPEFIPLSILRIEAISNSGEAMDVDVEKEVKLKYKFNSLKFTMMCPEFASLKNQIRYSLSGNANQWPSEDDDSFVKSYANLDYGHYVFQADLISDGVIVKSISFPFRVARPWYWSIFALIIYALLIFIVLPILMIRLYRSLRRLLVRLYDKNSEESLEHQFMRELKETYPSLTPVDLRFCSYLRKNMQTKDIANATNLSIRGVESARYRLRRKFDLSPEESLTDYLINFKKPIIKR